MTEDSLHLCPFDKWSKIEDLFKNNWPRSISGLTLLQMQKYALQCGTDHGIKLYCPFGDVRNGIVALKFKTSARGRKRQTDLSLFSLQTHNSTVLLTMTEDSLQLCPVDKWSELEELFKNDLPRSISGLTLLQMQRYMLQCGSDYGLKVYCPFGDGRNGIVGLNIKQTHYEIIVQCPSDDTSQMETALKTTNIIDWSSVLEVPCTPKHVMNCIQRIIDEKKLTIYNIPVTTTYMLNRSSPLFNVTLPPGFRFDSLSLKHIDLLNSTWPNKYPNSDFYFEQLIKAKLGYGLFRENKLVSWVLIKEMGALLHLFTLEEERRKGYGELVLKLISNFLLNNGQYVVGFCIVGNVNAVKLFQKLNFLCTDDVEWFRLTRKSN